jgi:hypothetical protein
MSRAEGRARRFKIVSVGWRCADWWERTVQSVQNQSVDNWDVWIMYDGGDSAGVDIQEWCDTHGDRWHCTINRHQQFAVRNQVEAIQSLAPADDDIVVFLDLDGDQLAHPDVLTRLAKAYNEGALVTYGQFKPVPPVASCGQAKAFPPEVIAANSYRTHMLTGDCCFNHLRTMSGLIAKAIPLDQFRWAKGPKKGEGYDAGTDYVFMVSALELAGGRFEFIQDTLLLYNHANPLADNISHPAESAACTQDFLRRPPLQPLAAPTTPSAPEVPPMTHAYLSAEERREVLREYGELHGLKILIETGTNDGGTPWALKDSFDKIYTIELGEKAWRDAKRRFVEHPHVHCLLGDSAVILPQVLNEVGQQPALIWLDGHWSGGITAHGSQDTPVLDELAAIFATGIPHVVLVDDARLFDGMPEHDEQPNWPHIDEVRALADKTGYRFELVDDIVRLTP